MHLLHLLHPWIQTATTIWIYKTMNRFTNIAWGSGCIWLPCRAVLWGTDSFCGALSTRLKSRLPVVRSFDLAVATAPSLDSVWPRSCHLLTAQWIWWQPCPRSTGSTDRAFSRRPTESWSPMAAWLCSTTPLTWSSATLTAARIHSTKSAKK